MEVLPFIKMIQNCPEKLLSSHILDITLNYVSLTVVFSGQESFKENKCRRKIKIQGEINNKI